MTLSPPECVTVSDMSGVTYLGPAAGGAHRFLAVEQTKGELLQFDLSLDAEGGVAAISNVTAIPIALASDFEGVAYTSTARNSVFVSDENIPGVRELNLATGAQMQNVAIPAVFTANKRPNLGFESLTRSPDAATMWTANEQALTVDGPLATASAGTTVRLLKFAVADNAVTAGAQYAYEVEPIHGASTLGNPQSGLSDLVAMPDRTLLALERSVAVATPIYLSRIYEVDLSGATDIGTAEFAAGLAGQAYSPAAKQLLWSGAADAAAGQNLEGLALGPRLASGSWTLIGVVDGGDGFSGNTIVSFTATANPSADFDEDGDADGEDFRRWQRGLGKGVGEGDADRDGDVDQDDLELWKDAAGATSSAKSIPEPTAAVLALAGMAMGAWAALARRARKSG
jgi:hypothetical protein